MTTGKRKNKKLQSLLQTGLFLGIVLLINILANSRFGDRPLYRYWDLTEEKRFTLTPATRKLVRELDDVVYVHVLLEGKFPAGFKRLQTAVRERLDDFRAESGFVEYQFEDPFSGSTQEINARMEQLRKDGIVPIDLGIKETGETTQKLAFPYAVFYYKGRSMPVNLLEDPGRPGVLSESTLNSSVSLLEYKFANAIQKLQRAVKPPVVFIEGHGELSPPETADLEKTLRNSYETGRIHLDSVVQLSSEIAAVVIAKPRFPFSEKDKFKIDQYVMNGGKVMWLIDPLRLDLDSLQQRDYIPLEYDLNLEDLLFRYGIRIQPNLILDIQCSKIPQVVGQVGDKPQLDYFDYPYHLVVTPVSDHPVVENLGLVNLFYPSTIDTSVRTKTDVRKTVLLTSSRNSRLQYPPLQMNFDILRYPLDPEKFDKGPQPVAMVLEGIFPSMYENRLSPEMARTLGSLGQEFRVESVPTKMIVISDGDLAKNKINWRDRSIVPLGYNEFVNYFFSNKDFLINAIEYLLDDQGVIAARGKEVKLRLLDTVRAENERITWQLINLVLPLAFLFAFGAFYQWRRKKQFGQSRN